MNVLKILIFLPFFLLTSCDKDEPVDYIGSDSNTSKNEVQPEIKIISQAATKDDFTVAFRVKSVKKPSIYFKWGSHSSSTPSPSLNNGSSVTHTYDEVKSKSGYTWYYYKVTHAGFNPGQYVYYQVEAYNSEGSAQSSVGHVIIKR